MFLSQSAVTVGSAKLRGCLDLPPERNRFGEAKNRPEVMKANKLIWLKQKDSSLADTQMPISPLFARDTAAPHCALSSHLGSWCSVRMNFDPRLNFSTMLERWTLEFLIEEACGPIIQCSNQATHTEVESDRDCSSNNGMLRQMPDFLGRAKILLWLRKLLPDTMSWWRHVSDVDGGIGTEIPVFKSYSAWRFIRFSSIDASY